MEDIRVSRSRPASCSPEKRAKIAPVLQAIATVIVLVTPCGKREVLGTRTKSRVDQKPNLRSGVIFFGERDIAKVSERGKGKRERRPFLLASKAKTEEGPPDRSLPKTEKSH